MLFALLPFLLLSQDIIRKTDGTELKVKIIEISNENIRYKALDSEIEENISPDFVNEIMFKDGSIKQYKHSKYNYELKSCQFNLDVLLLAVRQTILASYQYNFKDEKVAILLPIAANFKNKYYSGGFEVRFNLNESEASKIYIGPMCIGEGKVHYFVGPSLSLVNYEETNLKYNATDLRANIGVSLQQMWGLNATFYAGLGPRYNLTKSELMFDWNINFSLGYRFNKKTKI